MPETQNNKEKKELRWSKDKIRAQERRNVCGGQLTAQGRDVVSGALKGWICGSPENRARSATEAGILLTALERREELKSGVGLQTDSRKATQPVWRKNCHIEK